LLFLKIIDIKQLHRIYFSFPFLHFKYPKTVFGIYIDTTKLLVTLKLGIKYPLTMVTWNAASSTVGGFVLGMANIIVTPPANAAAVHVFQSSLCVAPGSLTCTCTSIKPSEQFTNVSH
jgi:hypothetical protein